MNFKSSLGILFLAGALGCAAAYYFPDGSPHPDDSTFHPQPQQLDLPTQNPSDLPPPPQNPADDEAHPPISNIITLGSEANYAFTTAGQSIRFRSKNYPRAYPNSYQNFLLLTSPSGTQMEVYCDDFNVEEGGSSCYYDFLGLGENLSSLQKFCGRGTFRAPISFGNKLFVAFKSDSSIVGTASGSPYGFQCTVTVTGSSPPESTAASPQLVLSPGEKVAQ